MVMNGFENHSIGNVSIKIGVTAEPSEEFSDVAHALGFVRVVPCFDCEFQNTPNCPVKDDDARKYMAFCSSGRKRNDENN